MRDSADTPPPLPRSSALAAIVSMRENLPPMYRDLIERFALEAIPENTRRVLESNLRYLAAWKRVAIGEELAFPESEDVVARFIVDQSADLDSMAPDDPPRLTADVLIDFGLRPAPAPPAAPSTAMPARSPRTPSAETSSTGWSPRARQACTACATRR